MGHLPVVIIAYNRPQYLISLLQSIQSQTVDVSDFDFFLSLDNDGSDMVDESLQLFHDCGLPNISVHKYNTHVGPAVNMYEVAERVFGWSVYDKAIFLEEDIILSPKFLEEMVSLFSKHNNDSTVGAVQCRDVSGAPMTNYGLWERSFETMRPFWGSYVDYVSQFEYGDAPVDELVSRFGALTQDSIKLKALKDAGLRMVTSSAVTVKHIGEVGLHPHPAATFIPELE